MANKKNKKEIEITLERTKDSQFMLFIKIPTELEKFFANISENKTNKSTRWNLQNGKGAEFYTLTPKYESMEAKINEKFSVFNNYGSGLYASDKINLAPLRTVGASKGITLVSKKFVSITNLDFQQYIRVLAECTKKIWTSFISGKKLRGVITFEI